MSVVALRRAAVKAPGWPVAVQLARREGMRLIRHPIFLLGALLSLAFFGLLTWQAAPVLHRDDTNVAGALLPLAAATLIVTSLAASREMRNGTHELYDGTPASSALRTVGHLLSLAFGVLGSFALICVMFVYMFLAAPVGTPRLSELLTGPVIVALLGAVGIALGRWRSHPALPPMAAVVVVALETLLIQPIIGLDGTLSGVTTRIPWLAPWVPMSLTRKVPPELVIRPSAWHLLYLVGLALLFAVLALSRHGLGRRTRALLVAGVAGAVLGAVGQLVPPSSAQRAALAAVVEDPEEHQVCRQRRGVTYCAYRAYAPWIDRWARPVEGVLDRIPPDERPEGLVVRQTLGSYFEGPTDLPPATVRRVEREYRRSLRASGSTPTFWTGPDWGRGKTEGEYEIGLALYAAMEAVGLPMSRSEIVLDRAGVERLKETMIPTLRKRDRARVERRLEPGRRWSSCHTTGQARALVAMWLAGQATPATRASVSRVAADQPYGLMVYEHDGKRLATYLGPFLPMYPLVPPPIWDRVSFADAEFHYAAKLLERPVDEVARVVTQRWDAVTTPTATTEALLSELDLAPHPTIAAQIAALPDDVALEPGRRMWNPEAYRAQTIPCP